MLAVVVELVLVEVAKEVVVCVTVLVVDDEDVDVVVVSDETANWSCWEVTPLPSEFCDADA